MRNRSLMFACAVMASFGSVQASKEVVKKFVEYEGNLLEKYALDEESKAHGLFEEIKKKILQSPEKEKTSDKFEIIKLRLHQDIVDLYSKGALKKEVVSALKKYHRVWGDHYENLLNQGKRGQPELVRLVSTLYWPLDCEMFPQGPCKNVVLRCLKLVSIKEASSARRFLDVLFYLEEHQKSKGNRETDFDYYDFNYLSLLYGDFACGRKIECEANKLLRRCNNTVLKKVQNDVNELCETVG